MSEAPTNAENRAMSARAVEQQDALQTRLRAELLDVLADGFIEYVIPMKAQGAQLIVEIDLSIPESGGPTVSQSTLVARVRADVWNVAHEKGDNTQPSDLCIQFGCELVDDTRITGEIPDAPVAWDSPTGRIWAHKEALAYFKDEVPFSNECDFITV